MSQEHPLQVARCTQIINAGQEDAKYVINIKQYAKFVVALGEKVSPTDIDEGMRVGVERQKMRIMVRVPGARTRAGGKGPPTHPFSSHYSPPPLPADPPPAADRPDRDDDAGGGEARRDVRRRRRRRRRA
jgi:hypothetical protein